MENKEKVNEIIEDAKEIVEVVEAVVDGTNEVIDAAEETGKKAGGLIVRIKNIIIKIIAFFKNLFKKKG